MCKIINDCMYVRTLSHTRIPRTQKHTNFDKHSFRRVSRITLSVSLSVHMCSKRNLAITEDTILIMILYTGCSLRLVHEER